MMLAAVLLSSTLLWMLRCRRTIRHDIERSVAAHVEQGHPIGIYLIALLSTAREGTETVIFLQAAVLQTRAGAHVMGAAIGIGVALLLSYLLWKGLKSLPIRTFFSVTSALLVLFAAGLIAHGVHEFQEIGLLPPLVEHLWNVSPHLSATGAYPLLHEKGAIGGILRELLGYSSSPSLLELASYLLYLTVIGITWRRMSGSRAGTGASISSSAREQAVKTGQQLRQLLLSCGCGEHHSRGEQEGEGDPVAATNVEHISVWQSGYRRSSSDPPLPAWSSARPRPGG